MWISINIIDRKDGLAVYAGFCKDFSLMRQYVRVTAIMWDEVPNSDIDEQ